MTNKENPENNPTQPVGTPEITPEVGTPNVPEFTAPEITPEVGTPNVPEFTTPEMTPEVGTPNVPEFTAPEMTPPVAQGIPAYNPAPTNYNPAPLGQSLLVQGPRKVRGSVIVVGIALIVALGLFLALGPLRGMIARGKLKSNPKAAITSASKKPRKY